VRQLALIGGVFGGVLERSLRLTRNRGVFGMTFAGKGKVNFVAIFFQVVTTVMTFCQVLNATMSIRTSGLK
jgi:hypothetical protein